MVDRKKDGASSSKTSQERKLELTARSNKVVQVPTTSSKSNPSKRMRTQDTTAGNDETNKENNRGNKERKMIVSEHPSSSGGGYQQRYGEVPGEKRKIPSSYGQAGVIHSVNRNFSISNDSRKEDQCKSQYHNSDEESPDVLQRVLNVNSSSELTKKKPEPPTVPPAKKRMPSISCPACGANNKIASEKICSVCKEFAQQITKENIGNLNCSKNESCEVNSDGQPRKCLYCRYKRCLEYGRLKDPVLLPTIRTTKTNETPGEKKKLVMKPPPESFKKPEVIPTISIEEKKKEHHDNHTQSQQPENVNNSPEEKTVISDEQEKTIEKIIRVYNKDPRYGQHPEDFNPKEYFIAIHEDKTMTRVEAWKNYSLELEKDIEAALPLICVLNDGLGTYDKTILFKESAFLIHVIRWNRALKPCGLLLPDNRLISLQSLHILYGEELVDLLYKFNGRIREFEFSERDLAMFATHVLYRLNEKALDALTDCGSYFDARADYLLLYSMYREAQENKQIDHSIVEELVTQMGVIQEKFWKMIEFLKPYEYMFPKNTSFETFYGLRPLFRSIKSQNETKRTPTNHCTN